VARVGIVAVLANSSRSTGIPCTSVDTTLPSRLHVERLVRTGLEEARKGTEAVTCSTVVLEKCPQQLEKHRWPTRNNQTS
jgi:hypothetical protein